MTQAGKANKAPSNLSSRPPCPGIILPESLTPKLRLNCDSAKSPTVLVILIIKAKIKESCNEIFTKEKYWRAQPTARVKAKPPMYPAHDFLGETEGNSFAFHTLPKVIPKR